MRRSTDRHVSAEETREEKEERMMSIRHVGRGNLIYALLETSPAAFGRNTIGGMCRGEFTVSVIAEDLRE